MSPLMLYTNLKDSDGIEIYEGDILEIEIECITGYKCKYKWTCPSIFEAFHGYQELQDIINKEGYKKAIVKVIGHIYK